jgi:hypothetical protein
VSLGSVNWRRWVAPAAIVLLAAGIGVALWGIEFDDPFVTYRYAQNLSHGLGFVYNVGERVLSTTAPLYALLLAVGAFVTPDIPTVSNVIGIAAIAAGGWWVYRLACRFGRPRAGRIAGLLYAAFPLLWLSLGFEVPLYLALVLGAFDVYFSGRFVPAAVLLALATLCRGDGVIPAALLFVHYLATQRRIPWRALLAYVLTAAPFVAFLWLTFGSPIPVTLSAKAAQTRLGVTGFLPGTTFPGGARILAGAWLSQSRMYWLLGATAMLGLLVAALRARRALWVVAWPILFVAGYLSLRVAPYHWYYAPLVPAGVLLAGLGAEQLPRWFAKGRGSMVLAGALGIALLVPLGQSLADTRTALHSKGAIDPGRADYKVLPEAKTAIYREVGLWLAANTPQSADVGVTEVGVMGYYSQRTMVDFLGLLRPPVADALRRGDAAWALFRYQPDYLALTEVNPLYSVDIRADEWFRCVYRPVKRFDDPRFWGSPVTVYERTAARVVTGPGVPPDALPVGDIFGGEIRLDAVRLDAESLRPGQATSVTLYWTALKALSADYTSFVHLLGRDDLVIAQRDGAPCLGGCPTSSWKPGQTIADTYLIGLPQGAYAPDEAQLEVGLLSPGAGVRLPVVDAAGSSAGDAPRFGRVHVLRNEGTAPNAMRMRLDAGITLIGYDVASRDLRAGSGTTITLYWQAERPISTPITATLRLLSEAGGSVVAESQSPMADKPSAALEAGALVRQELTIQPRADAPAGPAVLELTVQDGDGRTAAVLDAVGNARGQRVVLCKMRVE